MRAFDPFRPAELGQTLDPAVHRRYRARNQQPSRVISRSFRGTLHAPYGLLPFPVVVIRLFPAPRISGGFQFLARASHVIPQYLPFGPRSIRLITQADPSGIRIYHRLMPRIALQDKTRLIVTDLGDRFTLGIIPDNGGQRILPFPQIRSQIHRLETPVIDIPTGRTQGYQFPVYI